MLQGGGFPKWISFVALLGGVLGLVAGAGFYLAGFSAAGLFPCIGAQAILASWILAAGIVLYRRKES